VTERAAVWLAWRALLVSARTPALWAATIAHALLLALFLLVWGDGLPLVGARPVLEQFYTLQLAFLAVALPWAAVRAGAAPTRNGVTELAALGAVTPASVVGAAIAATTAVLAGMALGGLPFALLAQRISAAPPADLWAGQFLVLSLAWCVTTVSTACMLVLRDRLFAWVVATAATAVVLTALPAGLPGALVLLGLGAIVATVLVTGANARLAYLSESH
jgi:hypothetical protein